MSATEIAARRAAAVRAFWSNDPLNLFFRTTTGLETFSLKAFIAFVLAMSHDEFDTYVH